MSLVHGKNLNPEFVNEGIREPGIGVADHHGEFEDGPCRHPEDGRAFDLPAEIRRGRLVPEQCDRSRGINDHRGSPLSS